MTWELKIIDYRRKKKIPQLLKQNWLNTQTNQIFRNTFHVQTIITCSDNLLYRLVKTALRLLGFLGKKSDPSTTQFFKKSPKITTNSYLYTVLSSVIFL